MTLRATAARSLAAGPLEVVADGVWLIRGGVPRRTMNVYLVRDGDGVLVYDGGIRSMTRAVAAAGASLGGITRVVLGHGHHDHRGVPAGLKAPVFCHPEEVNNVEGDGGYSLYDFSQLHRPIRYLMPRLLQSWDGGPVSVAGTLREGDEVADFRVIHLPGHTDGLIGLWRERDRVALTSDCYFAVEGQTGRKCLPQIPSPAFTVDIESARQSMIKLAALEPSLSCPGHGDPLRGDVRRILLRAAARADRPVASVAGAEPPEVTDLPPYESNMVFREEQPQTPGVDL